MYDVGRLMISMEGLGVGSDDLYGRIGGDLVISMEGPGGGDVVISMDGGESGDLYGRMVGRQIW